MIETTAICVTRGSASDIRLAVNCWRQQTEPSYLFLVHQGLAIEPPKHPRIHLIECHEDKTLGELRNAGLDELKTPFWAQFDSDDLHRRDRLKLQKEVLSNDPRLDVCTLLRWTLYDEITDRAWITWPRPWEGSIFARKSSQRYPAMRIGEDTAFFERLDSNIAMLDRPDLYIYRCHGKNTYSRNHFMGLAARSERTDSHGLSDEFSALSGAFLSQPANAAP